MHIITLIFWILASAAVWAQAGNVTALVHVNLVPMTAETVIPDQAVLVKGGRIQAIGPSNHIKIPENSTVIDGSHGYLLPGLADMHMHLDANWFSGDWPVSPLYLYLANGITTIRDFGRKGKSAKDVRYLREGIERGDLIGPKIYACGEQLRGHLGNPEEMVLRQKAAGCDLIKLYSFLAKEEFQRVMTTAKRVGIYTAGHIPFQVGLAGVLAEGMDEIAHVEELFWEFVDFDRTLYFDNEDEWLAYIIGTTFEQYKPVLNSTDSQLRQLFSSSMQTVAQKLRFGNTPVCTTLYLDEVIVEKLLEPEKFLSKPENRYLPRAYIEAFEQNGEKHQVQFRGGEVFAPFKRQADLMLLRQLKEAGVELVLATDAGTGRMGLVPGFSLHQELRLLTRNGFTPYEAIKTATVNAAEVVKRMTGQVDFGRIEVGKRADLILTNGNPLDAVENIANPSGVMASGRWYDRQALQKMLEPGIPVKGLVQHVCEPDGRHTAYVEILIGKRFSGNLPGDIDALTVTGPAGKLPIGKDDFIYIPQLRDFFARIPGTPAIGMYTFEVIGGDNTGLAVDFQYVITTIPAPDITQFSPVDGATLGSTPPSFSWQAVPANFPVYYRFEIYKLHGGRVYATGYNQGMLSHTVPNGVLKSGQRYRWRIRAADSDDWASVQNRSNSEWLVFQLRAGE